MSTRTKKLVPLLDEKLGPASFAGFVRGARASKDLSQTDMARMLGVSRSALCDIEKGRHLVSPRLAQRIAEKCGLSDVMAVTLALQDQLTRAKIRLRVKLVA